MTQEQLTNKVMEQGNTIAALKENLKSAHKRIDENDQVTSGIHKIASNVEALALQVKLLTESMENSILRLESGLKNQGERIGSLEKEPGTRWKSLVAQITSLVVAATVGGMLSKLI